MDFCQVTDLDKVAAQQPNMQEIGQAYNEMIQLNSSVSHQKPNGEVPKKSETIYEKSLEDILKANPTWDRAHVCRVMKEVNKKIIDDAPVENLANAVEKGLDDFVAEHKMQKASVEALVVGGTVCLLDEYGIRIIN